MSESSLSSANGARVLLQEPPRPSDLISGVHIIVAAFASGAAFLSSLVESKDSAGELAVRTRYSPLPGTPVVLEVTWHGLPNRVMVRATAHKRWFGDRLILKLHPEERAKRDYLVRVADGTPIKVHRRRHRRFCVRLPLHWRRFGEPALTPGVAIDISSGGILIAAPEHTLSPGERVAVRLRAEDGFIDLVVTGIVLHIRPAAAGEICFGVKFEYRSGAEQRELRGLLRAFSARGVVMIATAANDSPAR